jgi:hypothetical protein
MTHGISAYRNAALQSAVAQNRVGDTRPASPEQIREASHSEANARTDRSASDLSVDERTMIDRYFPASPEMSMRIYGPGRQTTSVNPTAIGGRLDMRG